MSLYSYMFLPSRTTYRFFHLATPSSFLLLFFNNHPYFAYYSIESLPLFFFFFLGGASITSLVFFLVIGSSSESDWISLFFFVPLSIESSESSESTFCFLNLLNTLFYVGAKPRFFADTTFMSSASDSDEEDWRLFYGYFEESSELSSEEVGFLPFLPFNFLLEDFFLSKFSLSSDLESFLFLVFLLLESSISSS